MQQGPARALSFGQTAGNSGLQQDELRVVRRGLCGALLFCAFLQLLFFWSVADNVLTTLIALVSSLIGLVHSLNSRRFRSMPVSALIIFFYTVTSTAGALGVKTLEWTAVSDRLIVPIETFTLLFVGQLCLLVADAIYLQVKALHRLRHQLTYRLLVPTGVMRWPSDIHLWVFGAIGCASVVVAGTDFQSDVSFGMANAGTKVIAAFGFFKFAPFLIPFRDALCGRPKRRRFPWVLLAGYFGALIVLSFATNSRSTFADSIPTIGMCLLCAKALGRLDLRRVSPQSLVIGAIVAVLGGLLLSRVALAMVVARDYRYGSDTSSLISTTIEALFNTEWLNAAKAKMDSAINIGDYSEEYVNSRFFARFLLTKFHDNVMYYVSLMGPDQVVSLREFMWERLIANLPTPLVRFIDSNVDKSNMLFSNGDYAVYLVDGWGLGQFKTGSMFSEAWAAFGWMWPLAIIPTAVLLFVCYDSFTMPTAMDRMAVAPLILLMIWNLCGTTTAFGLGAETITSTISGVLRTVPQNVLVYAFTAWTLRQLNGLFVRR